MLVSNFIGAPMMLSASAAVKSEHAAIAGSESEDPTGVAVGAATAGVEDCSRLFGFVPVLLQAVSRAIRSNVGIDTVLRLSMCEVVVCSMDCLNFGKYFGFQNE